jgi:hypothetical protein
MGMKSGVGSTNSSSSSHGLSMLVNNSKSGFQAPPLEAIDSV